MLSIDRVLSGAFAAAQTLEIEWKKEAFNFLVLEETERNYIHDLVQNHRANDNQGFDDVVQHKGRGLVGLLAGPPGVGKVSAPSTYVEP